MKLEYVVIFRCHSNTGRLCQTSSEGKESVKDIKLDEEQNLSSELMKLLVELNKSVKDCFWVIHQVVSV